MKLSFKTLKGEQFALDVEPDDTVLSVKRRVGEYQGNADPAATAGYRLIYAGKVLKDGESLEHAGVKESGFVVVMPPAKAKPAQRPNPEAPPSTASAGMPAPAPATAAPIPAQETSRAAAPAAETIPATSSGGDSAAAVTAAAPTDSSAAPAAGGGASLLTGEAYETSVRRICDMGFPEDQVRRAMRAAFNNPDRAVEYLFSGIPEMPELARPAGAQGTTAAGRDMQAQAPSNQQAQRDPAVAPGTPFDMFGASAMPGTGAHGAGVQGMGANPAVHSPHAAATAGDPVGTGNLDFLRQLPQFNAMRRLIQANPGFLQQLLQQLDQVNPALLSIINANQAEFVRLINEQPSPGEEGGDETMEQLAAAMANAGGPGGGMAPPGQIYVTEQENEQLIRLTELGQTMGLERMHVVEAWLACDRNEQLAANYLYDHMDEIRAAQEENEAATQDNGNHGDDDHPGVSGPPS